MSMADLVEQQYSRWVYPLPVMDMRKAIADGSYREIADPYHCWSYYWPRLRSIPKNLTILSAGCGTNQAAYHACLNPDWEVIGIDLSQSSLDHQAYLKKRHNLKNLSLYKLDIQNVSSLKKNFDYITCTGVLHHMQDPNVGLCALRDVLKANGVMNLMVYGKTLRLGVYLMQDLFRTLGFTQNKEDVDLIRYTIESLPEEHVVKRYIKEAGDLVYDAGIVDTFLHPQDRAYSVREVFDFIRSADLEFFKWTDPLDYSLKTYVPAAHPLWSKLHDLNLEEASYACDLLSQSRGTHRFIAAFPAFVKEQKIPFDTDEFLDCTVLPHAGLEILTPANPAERKNAKCKRYRAEFEIDYRLSSIFSKLNLSNTIRMVLDEMRLNTEQYAAATNIARIGFKELSERGHITVLLPYSDGS